MYSFHMWRLRACTWLAVAGALALLSCHTASREEAAITESQQAISESLKELYMACSAAPPQSAAQQKLVLRMAEKASNGKELLLVMRAALGVFPAGENLPGQTMESRIRSIVAVKMVQVATLNQLIEYAMRYSVNSEDARPFAQRMFQLADKNHNPQIWYRIKLAAYRLRVGDLERQAQAKGDQLAGR
jgi:hypothetical protein